MTLKALVDGNIVIPLFPTDYSKSLIHQVAPLVIRFVDLIGQSQSVYR